MSMEQLLKFALTSKVIVSYEIDYLNSFHDRLMQGLWKRSSNGCFYKMNDRHEKLAYIILNENYEAEVEKSLEKFRKMSNRTAAQKVFDEISEPVLCESQIVPSEENDTHNLFSANEMNVSESCILQQGEVVCDADQVLDEMSESILSSNDSEIILFDNESVLAHNNGFQVSSDALEPHTSHDSMLNEVLSCDSGPICIDLDQSSSAHNMLDELPLPDFIKEMAQAASVVEENTLVSEIKADAKGFEYPHSPLLHAPILKAAIAYEELNIRQQDDLNEHNDHEKFHALDHSSLTHLVDIFSNARLFIPPPLVVKAGLILGEIPQNKVALHAGSLISGCSLSQVTTNPFLSFVGLENEMFCWGEMNVNHDDLLCSMMLEPTCLYQFVFDPGVLFLLSSMAEKDSCLSFFNFKIGWKAKINYKEVHSWGKLYTTLGWSEGLWSTIWLLHFQYDPAMSSQRVDYINEVVRLYPSNLHKLVLSLGIALMFNACELLLVFIGFEEQLTKKWLQFLFKSQYNSFLEIMTTYCNIRWIRLALSYSFSLTLEDKGDFRGEEDTSREYTWELFNPLTLWSHFSASRTNNSHLFLTFVFDPGILFCQSDLWDVHLHNSWFYSEPCLGLSLGFYVGHLTVYGLDACFLKLLLLCKAHTIYHVSIFALTLTTIPEDNGDFKEVIVICQWRTTWIVKCTEKYLRMCCSWLNFLKRVAIMQENFVRFRLFDGYLNISNFIFVLGGVYDNLSAQILNARLLKLTAIWGSVKHGWKGMKPLQKLVSTRNMGFETVWVFDPGGDENFFTGESWCTKRTNRAQTCQYGGGKQLKDKRNEDIRIYVFDPGGPFVRLVIDDLVTNSQLGRCHVTHCFKY